MTNNLPPDQAKPIKKDNLEHEDTQTTKPENKQTLNPLRKEFWEAGQEPGDETMPQLKWVFIASVIIFLVIIVTGIAASFSG